jgi:hypothetical protein
MQWADVAQAVWRQEHCRVVKHINFHPRMAREPLAHVYGLAPFQRNFLLRARTQLRVLEDTEATLQVHAAGGFQLDVHEVGREGSQSQDELLQDFSEVLTMARPQAAGSCKRHVSDSFTLHKGRIYVVDARFWQADGIKCFKARPLPSDFRAFLCLPLLGAPACTLSGSCMTPEAVAASLEEADSTQWTEQGGQHTLGTTQWQACTWHNTAAWNNTGGGCGEHA